MDRSVEHPQTCHTEANALCSCLHSVAHLSGVAYYSMHWPLQAYALRRKPEGEEKEREGWRIMVSNAQCTNCTLHHDTDAA